MEKAPVDSAVDEAIDSLVRTLEGRGRSRTLERDEVLFQQGDEAHSIYSVHEGRLRLERHLSSGVAVTVSLVRAPAVLAEASLFVDHYHCRAIAETPCRISRVAKSTVLKLLELEPDFSRAFVRALAAEVRDLRARAELRNVRPLSARVLQYLRLREDRGRPPDDRPLAALASELGVTPEALYRALSLLEEAGEIRRQGRHLLLAR